MNMEMIYQDLGISAEVLRAGEKLEQELKDRFDTFDKTAEYNQLKVIHAMQKNKVSEGCFQYASGYGYNDMGRDTLEQVYADTFHTEAALVVHRSLAELTRWRLRFPQIYVRGMNYFRR